MAIKVPTTRTPIPLEQLVGPFVRAFHRVTGELPEAIDVAFVFGKKVAENGWPGPNETTWCNNFGNRRGVSPAGKYCVLKGAWELAKASSVPGLIKMGYVIMDPPPPQAKVTPGMVCVLPPPEKQGFCAYDTLEEAADHYVVGLRQSFRRTFEELIDKDTVPDEVVEAMKLDGYFTGDLTQYKKNVRSGVAWALPKVAALMASLPRLDSAPPDTLPDSPTGKSSQTMKAVAATPIRAGEGEHTPDDYDPKL